MGLADFETALKMRDTLQRLVASEVENQRPRLQYATVTDINRTLRKCKIQYPGETSSIWISMGSIQPLTTGQVVRVDGLLGDRFVSDVMGATYSDTESINVKSYGATGNGTTDDTAAIKLAIADRASSKAAFACWPK